MSRHMGGEEGIGGEGERERGREGEGERERKSEPKTPAKNHRAMYTIQC